jgi:hypothetical protein
MSRGGYNNNNDKWGPSDDNGGQNRPRCQVCLRVGHTANMCWYHFDEDYVPDQRVANMAFGSTSTNPNWYLDSGATDHITGELEKLTMNKCYIGHNQIRSANGAGMEITHVDKFVFAS